MAGVAKSHRKFRNIVAPLLLLTAIYGLYQISSMAYFMQYRTHEVMNEFGFGMIDAYPRINGETGDFVGIGHLQADGLMYQAGFREGDLLQEYPTGWGLRKFIRQIDSRRGEEIVVKVVESGDGPPLMERPARTIRLSVPEIPSQ